MIVTLAEWLNYLKWGHEPLFENHCFRLIQKVHVTPHRMVFYFAPKFSKSKAGGEAAPPPRVS